MRKLIKLRKKVYKCHFCGKQLILQNDIYLQKSAIREFANGSINLERKKGHGHMKVAGVINLFLHSHFIISAALGTYIHTWYH